ncbi:TPA: DUF2726 domain-containing protein [Acinetobacter baumannii]|uniref:DUF2726 domain-containing protein n=1 Tax=Acinetobacter baumannii TaxID=470 RepID=UPI00338E73D0
MGSHGSVALVIAIVSTILLVYLCLFSKKKPGFENTRKRFREIQIKKVLNENEVPLYFDIAKAFPSHIVLCQVSFNALITTRELGLRNRFNRNMADYVLVDKEFNPVCVIELDDRSHLYTKDKDLQRDTFLNSAGIPVLRFYGRPTYRELKKTIKQAI